MVLINIFMMFSGLICLSCYLSDILKVLLYRPYIYDAMHGINRCFYHIVVLTGVLTVFWLYI